MFPHLYLASLLCHLAFDPKSGPKSDQKSDQKFDQNMKFFAKKVYISENEQNHRKNAPKSAQKADFLK